jgi:hypothetical protein
MHLVAHVLLVPPVRQCSVSRLGKRSATRFSLMLCSSSAFNPASTIVNHRLSQSPVGQPHDRPPETQNAFANLQSTTTFGKPELGYDVRIDKRLEDLGDGFANEHCGLRLKWLVIQKNVRAETAGFSRAEEARTPTLFVR